MDLVELVSETVALRRLGRNWVGLCPFHDEKTPSFHVTPERGLFYCYGCHAGGDAFNFLMRREGCTFPEAVERLAVRAGVRLPERRLQDPILLEQRESVARALGDAAHFYSQRLAAAAAYIEARDIAPQTAERFGLGYAPPEWDALLRALTRMGHAPETLEKAGLVVARPSGDGHYDRFRNRLMFPIHDDRGRVVAFGGRALGDDHPKYTNSPETPLFSKRRTWYGLYLARESIRREGRAIVVEGYMDVVTAHQHGFACTVASLGTALSAEQAGTIARHAEEVCVAYDADAAGAAATLRGLGILQQTSARVRVVSLPAGRDPDEFLRHEGEAAFGRAVASATSLVEYVADRAAAGRNLAGRIEDRVAAAEMVAPFIVRCREVERARYSELVARRLLLPAHEFQNIWRRMVEKGEVHKGSGPRENTKDSARSVRPGPASAAIGAQEGLLALAAADASHLHRVRARAVAEDFAPGAHRMLFEALSALADAGDGTPGERVLETGVEPEVRSLVGRLAVVPLPVEDQAEAREGWLGFLEKRRMQLRADGIRARLARGDAVAPADLEELHRLLAAMKVPGLQRSNVDG